MSGPDQLLAELVRLSPELAGRIRAVVYGPLEHREPELARTLDVLIEHGFQRAATAAAIPVHRNTLRDRLARITALTGVDLSSSEGCALALLAWLVRRVGV